MTQPKYETAQALVYDPVASNRNATRAALRSLGFGRMEVASSLEGLRESLAAQSPDLVLCEVGGAEAEVCALVQSIRQGKLGDNAFVVVIATTWRRDGTIVNRAINSGADDLLARPFSAAMLGERLKCHIERRKGFVVTNDYIGPDRRRDPARAGMQCFDVPNSLRTKTVLGLAEGEAEQCFAAELREGKRVIGTEKLRRDAREIYFQWNQIEGRGLHGRDVAAALARIDTLSTGMGRRASETRLAAAVEPCRAVHSAVRAAIAAPADGADSAKDLAAAMHSLSEAVAALRQAVPPGMRESDPLEQALTRITPAKAIGRAA